MSEILTREVMGVFALGVLWLNTLLVAAAALGRARELARRRSLLRPLDLEQPGSYGLVRAEASGDGLAVLAIEQVGRHAAGKKRAILWHDRRHVSTVRGGTIDVPGTKRAVRVAAATGDAAEAWAEPERMALAARCADAAVFDAAFPDARKARGTTRTIKVDVPAAGKVDVPAGGPVWIAGTVRNDGDQVVIGAGDRGRPLVVSEIDPRAWLGGRITMLFVFAPAVVVGAALTTAVALWPPVFDGAISKVGALLCFVYFLLVLPAGTRARDAALEPPRRFLRGRWDDPENRDVPAPAASRG